MCWVSPELEELLSKHDRDNDDYIVLLNDRYKHIASLLGQPRSYGSILIKVFDENKKIPTPEREKIEKQQCSPIMSKLAKEMKLHLHANYNQTLANRLRFPCFALVISVIILMNSTRLTKLISVCAVV